MSDIVPSTQNLSIFQIESELAELMELRDTEELAPEERQAVDTQIANYVSRELTKVDNLRAYMRHCQIMADAAKVEADLQAKRANSWKTRLDYLKGCCLGAMEIMKKKRLDGRTGYLLAKANGGKQTLTIYDASLIPEHLVIYRGLMRPEAMAAIPEQIRGRHDFIFDRDPMGEAIRAAMELSCVQCGGLGSQCPSGPSDAPLETCTGCDGTGKTRVPGARLEPRGTHCEVK